VVPAEKALAEPARFLQVIDLRSREAEDQESAVMDLLSEHARRPFDLNVYPLFRFTLARLDDRHSILALVIHHIITDGWSCGVLMRELGALYKSLILHEPSPLAELEIQYPDYASWQRERLQGELLDEELSYWKNHLRGELPILQLPTDYPRPPAGGY